MGWVNAAAKATRSVLCALGDCCCTAASTVIRGLSCPRRWLFIEGKLVAEKSAKVTDTFPNAATALVARTRVGAKGAATFGALVGACNFWAAIRRAMGPPGREMRRNAGEDNVPPKEEIPLLGDIDRADAVAAGAS